MIRQPDRYERNITDGFYAYEAENISRLNEIFGEVELSRAEEQTLVWLAGWERSTVNQVIRAIRKVIAADVRTAGTAADRPQGEIAR